MGLQNQYSTTQSTSQLGAPIMQYGYQNKYGPMGMRTNLNAQNTSSNQNPENSPYKPGYVNMPGVTYNEDVQAQRGHPGQTSPGGSTSSGSGSGSSGPTNSASAWYNGVLSGTNLPYSPFAKANLESKATGMNAAAETARNQTMVGNAAANGASASDPSMAGAKLNSMAHRQTDNASSVQDIESQANQANFAAQANAAAHLSQTQLAYDEMANSNAMRYSPFGGGGGSSRGRGGQSEGAGSGFAFLPTGKQPPSYREDSGGDGDSGGGGYVQDPYKPSALANWKQTQYRQDMADQRHQQYMDQQEQGELDSGWADNVKNGGKGQGQSNGFRAPPPGAPRRTAGGAPIDY